MDTLTHLAVGACMGELFLGKQLGRRALLWGAVAQSAPDADVVANLWMEVPESLLAHRGFTHSFLFAAVLIPLFALAADRWHRPHDIPFQRFLWFFGVAVVGHDLLDGLNAYGTGWFEPFGHQRIALDVLFVADPFFSVGVGIATLVLLFVRRHYALHRPIAAAGLLWCATYIIYCAENRRYVHAEVDRLLAQQHVRYDRLLLTPTIMNSWLWFVVAEDGTGFHLGYRSVFDKHDTLALHFVPRRAELLAEVNDEAELALLTRFSQGWYSVEQEGGALLFNDLRFGQVMGWRDAKAPFAFRYHLLAPGGNDLVVQRGRFAGWNKEAVNSLVQRIRGITADDSRR